MTPAGLAIVIFLTLLAILLGAFAVLYLIVARDYRRGER